MSRELDGVGVAVEADVLEEVEVVGVGVAGREVAPGERGAEDRHGGGPWPVGVLEAQRVLVGYLTHLGGLASSQLWERLAL